MLLSHRRIRSSDEGERELGVPRAVSPTAYVNQRECEAVTRGRLCGESGLDMRGEVVGAGGREVEGHRRFTTAVQVVPVEPGTRWRAVAAKPGRLRL